MSLETSPSACPWAKTTSETPQKSFVDLMEEEHAKQLQTDEDNHFFPDLSTVLKLSEESADDPNSSIKNEDTNDDFVLAQILQMEYDHENDLHVKSMEKVYNGTSKVSMSFKNFHSRNSYDVSEAWCSTDSSDDEEDLEVNPSRPGEIITKHDTQLSERKNARNVEKFPLGFNSGDVGQNDIRLPNHVYNSLKVHSRKEQRNAMRVHDKQEHSTHEKALDENTRLILYKMVNNEMLDSMNGIVSTGKEAVVIHAKGGHIEDKSLPSECALKVFKTTQNEFKTRQKYIKDDHRFRDRYSKQHPRKVIRLWAEKEFRNLTRMREAGVNCPRPVCLRKHVLVMSFVGTNQIAAPKLKDAVLSTSQLICAYSQCVEAMKTLYDKCNLIHADLSEYNILWHDNRCFFIDVSQSIEPSHPHALHFLLRDCRNVVEYFSRMEVEGVMTVDELYKHVCGRDISEIDEAEKEFQLLFEKNKELLTFGLDSKNYPFDYHFELTRPKDDKNSSEEQLEKEE